MTGVEFEVTRRSIRGLRNPADGGLGESQPGVGMTGRTSSASRFNEGWIPAFAGMTEGLRAGLLGTDDYVGWDGCGRTD